MVDRIRVRNQSTLVVHRRRPALAHGDPVEIARRAGDWGPPLIAAWRGEEFPDGVG
jgi:hypothetical protein